MHAECADAISLFFIINKLFIVILFIALQFTALHWILSPESDHQASLLIPLIEDFSITEGYRCSPSPMQFFQCVLVVSPQQVIAVAELTEGQHQNALWAAVRKHEFTVSNFDDILKAVECNRLDFFRQSLTAFCNC
jgi:hypothetical protein